MTSIGRLTASSRPTVMPWSGLFVLFAAGFLGIMNETIPAGLLPQMSADLGLPEAAVGQVTTVYAVATALTAIPLQALFKGVGRRTLLLSALAGFATASAATAVLQGFAAILIARFVAGVAAGVIWSNIGGFAGRIAPAGRESRGVAIALAGTPIALSLGLPAGTVLGTVAGWQATFAAVGIASIGVLVWSLFALPNLPGTQSGERTSTLAILRAPGVAIIVLVTAGFIVAHNLVYTYIGPLASLAGVRSGLGWVLLVFGVAAVISIVVTGRLLHPHHRRLVVLSTLLLGSCALVLAFTTCSPQVLFTGTALWGLGFGGSATLFLTAAIRAAGTDSVQAIIVTTFNISIAIGGAAGGALLAAFGVLSIPWVVVVLMLPVVVLTIAAQKNAFPRW